MNAIENKNDAAGTGNRSVLIFLAILVSLGPLSIDMYVPAMPSLQVAMQTGVYQVHLTMSAYLTGFAVFHLFCGPLADRFGRIPILSTGTILFVGASLACAFSPTIEALMASRFVQGIGACVGPTLARAMARDIYGPKDSARALSLIAMIMALAPAIAPGLGAAMLKYVAWPGIFAFLAIYGLLALWLVRTKLTETLPAKQSLHFSSIISNYRSLISYRTYLCVALASALAYSGMMAFITSSGFIFISFMGVPVEYFGLIFLVIVLGYMAGSALSARLSHSMESGSVLTLGVGLAVGATAIMACLQFAFPQSLWALVAPVPIFSCAMGLTLPNATAIALEPFPLIAATASSLFGFLQMGSCALVIGLAGQLVTQSPAPLLWALIVVNLFALILVYLGLAARKRTAIS
ncbi:MAG: multidrug effflux MFS transporter [Pseudomonadota bacterium]